MEYKKYRVKTTIKSFRDLEVYKRTTALSAELFTLNPPDGAHNKHLENELEVLRELSKYGPKYIAESYGDRYSDKTLGIKKLEKAAQIISEIIFILFPSLSSDCQTESLGTIMKLKLR